jgi:two-component system, cell cycle sensor histidine kinase and response regulator CckA
VNLVVNARDAVAAHGRITIRTDSLWLADADARKVGIEPGAALRLQVRDDGCGIDEATQSRIFEPFFTSKPVGQGTGLGLSTVYAIVKRSKGAISVQSAPGAGTTIDIWLPRHPPIEGADKVVAAPSVNGRNERVLLVEDERVVRELVGEVLERRGYEVTAAASPADALALCDTGVPFDVVVTDVVMPGMNGRELVESLRRLTNDLRVVYVSGYADDVLPADSLRDGERFLQKPFQLDALIATVRETLEAQV